MPCLLIKGIYSRNIFRFFFKLWCVDERASADICTPPKAHLMFDLRSGYPTSEGYERFRKNVDHLAIKGSTKEILTTCNAESLVSLRMW